MPHKLRLQGWELGGQAFLYSLQIGVLKSCNDIHILAHSQIKQTLTT